MSVSPMTLTHRNSVVKVEPVGSGILSIHALCADKCGTEGVGDECGEGLGCRSLAQKVQASGAVACGGGGALCLKRARVSVNTHNGDIITSMELSCSRGG